MKKIISSYVPSPALSTPPARGVRYFRPVRAFQSVWGAMNDLKLGRKRRKHIIVRRYPYKGKYLLQLYTYHFPTHWSDACVANRELIKIAQRQAHALEHDTSRAGIEWRIRFFKHYFTVFKGGAKPEPGLKPYSRFYQYAYVAIYRELQRARQQSAWLSCSGSKPALSAAQSDSSALTPDDVTFDPISEPILKRPVLNPHFSMTPTRIEPPDIAPFIPSDENYCPNICIYQKKAVPLQSVLEK